LTIPVWLHPVEMIARLVDLELTVVQ